MISDAKLALAISLTINWCEMIEDNRRRAKEGGEVDLRRNNAALVFSRLLDVYQRAPIPWTKWRIHTAKGPVEFIRLKVQCEEAMKFVAILPEEVAERCIRWVPDEAAEDAENAKPLPPEIIQP